MSFPETIKMCPRRIWVGIKNVYNRGGPGCPGPTEYVEAGDAPGPEYVEI